MTEEQMKEQMKELLNPTIISIILWYRSTTKGVYEYNHFERTRDNCDISTPNMFIKTGVQKSWKNQKWKYSLGLLNTKTHKIIEEGDLT